MTDDVKDIDIKNFLYDIIESDLESGKVDEIHTRFPPEPNGYLHIGSAKAIYINYMAAKKYGGKFNLRYDDTNPLREDDEYVRSIHEDLLWLGAVPDGGVFFGSDYFEKSYEYAVLLINKGLAFVCDLSSQEIEKYRGTFTEAGVDSPYRNRSVEENLSLFAKMRAGDFPTGHCTLRAKIDMSHPNMNMRDPVIYRVLHATHHRQGDEWCIYPLYDYAHPIQDAIEGITHSMCSLEFENHRPLYDWVLDSIGLTDRPYQYEFARLNVTNTVMSKRYLRKLVETEVVDGWDDPRLPTLSGLRRRGYSPTSIFKFIELTGIAKNYSVADISLLEHCIRAELNETAQRRFAILDPIKVIIENYPEDKIEEFEVSNNPSVKDAGTRKLPFSRNIFIDRSDFSENPPSKYFRLKPDGEVRLLGAYIIKHKETIHNSDGSIKEIICTADLDSRSGSPGASRKVKGTIHWLCADRCERADINMYSHLFTITNTNDISDDETYDDYLNPDSLVVLKDCAIESSLADAKSGEKFQFVRVGYFCKDSKNANSFNLITELRDSKPTK